MTAGLASGFRRRARSLTAISSVQVAKICARIGRARRPRAAGGQLGNGAVRPASVRPRLPELADAVTVTVTVTVSEIFTEAQLSTRSFHRHFKSKDQLLLSMFEEESGRATAQLTGRLSSATDPYTAIGE
ncbi:TetR family transcriptional regulator [Frankia tisae]|uniref:TetR family transcriptional regulator n=1 Tax=Frankia tisae TaxID=2950104 RepID=UPI0021BFFD6D|nr:TetR family transcriptional regulator [Frankia tisae]